MQMQKGKKRQTPCTAQWIPSSRSTASCLTESFSLSSSCERGGMFNPSPTARGKTNAYLTISSVSWQGKIEILIHFQSRTPSVSPFFPPLNVEADRHGCRIYSMNTHGLMHSTEAPRPGFAKKKEREKNVPPLSQHKGKGKRTKLFLKLSIKLLHSWQSLKGMSVLLPRREVIILFLSENNKW